MFFCGVALSSSFRSICCLLKRNRDSELSNANKRKSERGILPFDSNCEFTSSHRTPKRGMWPFDVYACCQQILVQIFSVLPKSCLKNVSQVCKRYFVTFTSCLPIDSRWQSVAADLLEAAKQSHCETKHLHRDIGVAAFRRTHRTSRPSLEIKRRTIRRMLALLTALIAVYTFCQSAAAFFNWANTNKFNASLLPVDCLVTSELYPLLHSIVADFILTI